MTLGSGLHKLDLGGVLTIPLNKQTYAYCWKHVFIGVILDYPETPTQEGDDEANEDNNDSWFEIIFDCKGKVYEQIFCPLCNMSR